MPQIVSPKYRGWRLVVFFVFLYLIVPTTSVSAQEASSAKGASSEKLDLSRIEVLDLDTAVKITLAKNPTIAAARARVEQATQLVRQARSAYWPTVDVSVGGSWVDMSKYNVDLQENNLQFLSYFNSILSSLPGVPSLGDLPTNIKDPRPYYSAGATATWLIFSGFARKLAVASSRYGEQASLQEHNDIRRSLMKTVIEAYLNAQLARENITISQADAAFNNRLLTEAKLRYDVGAGALSDVINFQVLGNASQTQIIQNQFNYESALIGLSVLMGVSQARLPDHIQLAPFQPTTDKELADLDPDQLITDALANRPDIRQVEIAIQVSQTGVKLAKSDYYPKVALSANIEGQRPDDVSFTDDDFGATIALGLSYNLFSGGLTRAKVGQAKAKVYEMQSNLQSMKLNVAREVQSVVAQIRSVQKQLALQETSTQLVQQQRDLVEKEYKSGVGSLVRLNEAQSQLKVAQGRLAQTRVSLRLAWLNLQAVTGHILTLF